MDYGVKIELNEEGDFLKVAETLTRIGILSRDNTLNQTAHILHKSGDYYIMHFKELFQLDGTGKTEVSDTDIQRRNGIVKLLENWNLCKSLDTIDHETIKRLKIIPFSKKNEYTLKQNYTIGKFKK